MAPYSSAPFQAVHALKVPRLVGAACASAGTAADKMSAPAIKPVRARRRSDVMSSIPLNKRAALLAIACQPTTVWLPSSQSPGVHCIFSKITVNRVGNLTRDFLGFSVTPLWLTAG
jgi:hypothetical protein